jgi:hypothetical protein
MSIKMLSRLGLSLFLVVIVSGCSSVGSERSIKCKWVPSSCIHEGSYEPGEKEYAEDEAKDLNRDASRKLRRSAH